MNEFIKCLNKIKIPVTITQIEMNNNTSDKLLRTIPTSKQLEKIGYLHISTGVPIIINDELDNGEVKILYSDDKYSTISTIEAESIYKNIPLKMEYECKWR